MTTRPTRVLLVDDADDLRTLLKFRLAADPRFEVVGEAADGATAIEAAIAVQPDVIVLDHWMPVLSGGDALPQLRQGAPAARVVMFTAVTVPDFLTAPDAIVSKGEDLAVLIDTVDALGRTVVHTV